MRHLKYMLTAALAAVLAFASCTKEIEAPDETGQEEESYSRETGAPVVFGASTGYDNGPETKVEYSGIEYGGYERINWELDDKISIYCKDASAPESKGAEYKISRAPEHTGRYSKARIAPAGDSWLKWGEEETHLFYGTSPEVSGPGSPAVNKVTKVLLQQAGAMATIKAEVPQFQELESEPLMTGYASANKNSGVPVTLYFTPAVNTFDITLINDRPTPIHLKSVGLKSLSEEISGNFDIVIIAGGLYGRKEYDLREPRYRKVKRIYNNGLTLEPQTSQKVRIYTMPQDISKLCLILEETNNKITALDLKDNNGNWIKFLKEKKYNFTDVRIPENPEDFYYTFSPTKDTLIFRPFSMKYPSDSCQIPLNKVKFKSYRVNMDGSKNYAVPWTFDFNQWMQEKGTKLFYTSQPGNSANIGDEIVVRMKAKSLDEEAEAYREALREFKLRPRATEEDLSMINGTRNTANCYVVRRPGTYCFPMICGNSIKNGEINNEAIIQENGRYGIIRHFPDGAGNLISTNDSYVSNMDVQSVKLIWEDAKVIKNVYMRDGSIHFKVDPLDTDFGNAVIAAINSEEVILWTWHIWVTNQVFNTQQGEFLGVPLGYTMPKGGYKEEVYDFELRQIDAKGKEATLRAKRRKGIPHATCTYYAFGRMTPIMPTYGPYYIHQNKTFTTMGNYYTFMSSEITEFSPTCSEPKECWQAISSPGTICEFRRFQNGDFHFLNLWNNNYFAFNLAEDDQILTTKKTVYDPCPVGYSVPSQARMRVEPYSNMANWPKMGGIGACSNNSAGEPIIPIYNFARRASYHSAWKSRNYPANGGYENVVYMPIMPVKENNDLRPER